MARSSTVARVAALMGSALVLGACDDGIVHLGDGRAAKDGGGTGDTDAAACQRGQIKASEVLWIGDTWLTYPDAAQSNRVRDYARIAGAIGATDEYVVAAAAGSDMPAVAKQYESQQSSPIKPKVLIMDGGTFETIISGATDAVIANAVATFRQLLARVDGDGTVEHIVYVMCPALAGIPAVPTLGPLLQQACDDSAVPCHFLDLDPLWRPEYTAATGYQANQAGAIVIGDAIWEVMQDNCIAQ